MRKFLAGLVVFTVILSKVNATEIYIQQAVGKTNLSAEKCAIKAKNVFEKLSLSNIVSKIDLADGKKLKYPNKNSPRTIQANDKERAYSIQCRSFGSNLVFFTTAGKKSNMLQKIWNAFYNIK